MSYPFHDLKAIQCVDVMRASKGVFESLKCVGAMSYPIRYLKPIQCVDVMHPLIYPTWLRPEQWLTLGL